jgi:hypothetical protein
MLRLAKTSFLLPLLTLGVAAAAIAACSAIAGQQTTGTGGSAGTGGGDIGFGAGHQGGAGGAGSCAAEPHVAKQIPLDVFIMLDQSGSMADVVAGSVTKWDAVTGALAAFVQQPGLANINVGLQYFGLPVITDCPTTCASDAECGIYAPCSPSYGCVGCSADSCDAVDYYTAAVDFAPLPGAASAIVASLGQHSPHTNTPTAPALQGGVDYCSAWAWMHPDHAVVLVFATDGQPGECDTDLDHIDAIAAEAAAATPRVLTFVVGVGSALTALDGIAAAGGTNQAYVVDTNQDANEQFLKALNDIRGAALGCVYDIPQPTQGAPEFGKVNVQYTPGGGGGVQIFNHYLDAAHCPASGSGWYYDDNQSPKVINLCDATCAAVSADGMAKIDILLGCQTKDPA